MSRETSSVRRSLIRDTRGATLVEFAVVAPIFIGILLFIFDTAYLIFARAILRGEVNAVARASTMETATNESRAVMDARVIERVRLLVPHGELDFDRAAFGNYTRAQARVEPFVDNNDSNACDSGESFLDLNGNGQHDLDGGRTNVGDARDVVVYTVSLQYDRLFPVAGLLGLNESVQLQAQTLLKNQPFGVQAQPTTGTCP